MATRPDREHEHERGRDGRPDPGAVVRKLWVWEYRLWHRRKYGTETDYGRRRLPRWDGGVDASGRAFSGSVWGKVAAHCGTHGVEPRALVRAYFAALDPTSARSPVPTRLLSSRLLEACAGARRTCDVDLACRLADQESAYRTQVVLYTRVSGLAIDAASRRVLRDPGSGLSPLFRHAVARKAGDRALARLFAEEALLQYLFHDEAYDRTWGELIPRGLRKRARRLLAQLTQ